MAEIVELRASARRSDAARHSATGSAEVVLFPGIRYEYWQEASPSPARARYPGRGDRRAPTRDLLEIES